MHIGSITVIFAWLDLTLLLGRLPSTGIFIYMALNVLKTVAIFLMLFFPILVAFSVSFFILLPKAESHINLIDAILRVSLQNNQLIFTSN